MKKTKQKTNLPVTGRNVNPSLSTKNDPTRPFRMAERRVSLITFSSSKSCDSMSKLTFVSDNWLVRLESFFIFLIFNIHSAKKLSKKKFVILTWIRGPNQMRQLTRMFERWPSEHRARFDKFVQWPYWNAQTCPRNRRWIGYLILRCKALESASSIDTPLQFSNSII